MAGTSDLDRVVHMWTFFEFVWDHICLEWFFGNTGRLIIKTLTFGQIDLDLDRWGHSFIAVIVGLIFWALVVADKKTSKELLSHFEVF